MRRTAVAFVGLVGIAAVTAVAAVTQASAQPASADLDQATVVAIFDAANTFDIETGALAAKRAQNKEVRDYGTMLSQVHTAVRKNGRDLAAKLGVTPTAPKDFQMAKDHAQTMKRLQALQGAEFDRAFLQHEQAFHAAVLSAVKTALLPAIQNQELKDFVISLAPAFEAHRLAAENLEKKEFAEK
jgi:putative membrane protein